MGMFDDLFDMILEDFTPDYADLVAKAKEKLKELMREKYTGTIRKSYRTTNQWINSGDVWLSDDGIEWGLSDDIYYKVSRWARANYGGAVFTGARAQDMIEEGEMPNIYIKPGTKEDFSEILENLLHDHLDSIYN